MSSMCNLFTYFRAAGVVVDAIDLSGLYPLSERQAELTNPDAVLNGIAWDSKSKALYVTGKLWKRLYKLQLLKSYAV